MDNALAIQYLQSMNRAQRSLKINYYILLDAGWRMAEITHWMETGELPTWYLRVPPNADSGCASDDTEA